MADFSNNLMTPEEMGNVMDLTNPALPMMPPLSPAPSAWGDVKAVGMAPVRTVADIAGAATIIGGGLVGAFEYPGDHAASDMFFKAYDDYIEPAKKRFTPDPESVSWAGKIAGGVAGLAPYFALGPAGVFAMISSATINTGVEMVNQGVSPTVATGMGVLSGLTTAAMAEIPMLGKTYAQKIVAGGLSFAGMSMVGEAVQKKALQMAGYEDIANGINPYDLKARAVDLAMGMFFGGMSHYMEARGKMPIRAEDAIDVVGTERNVAKSNPFEPRNIEPHKVALDKAEEDLNTGRPVDVAEVVKDIPLKAESKAPESLQPEIDALARKMADGVTDFTDGEVKLYMDNAKAVEARTNAILGLDGKTAFQDVQSELEQHGVAEPPPPPGKPTEAPEPPARVSEAGILAEPAVYGTLEKNTRGEKPRTLADFVRNEGGISTKDEFLKAEVKDRFSIKEGYNLINNDTGKTLDRLGELATEAGYFRERPSVSEFLDALRSDVDMKMNGRGKSVYSMEHIDEYIAAQLEAEFQKHMERHGDIQLQTGTDTAGEPVKISARESVDAAKADMEKTSLLDAVIKAAEDCFAGEEETPF